MGNQPLSGDLPSHIRGRGNSPGPMTGGYLSINIGINTVAASQTDLEVGAVYLPFACKVMAISASCTTSTGGATRGTFQVTDGTDDLITSDTLLVTASSAQVTAASTGLVAAQQIRAKGDRLQVDITTVTSEVVTALNVCITVFVLGHIHADSAND